MPRFVINQAIGVNDSFFATENDVPRWDEWEMPPQPAVLCRE
jgi:hypothetical protein